MKLAFVMILEPKQCVSVVSKVLVTRGSDPTFPPNFLVSSLTHMSLVRTRLCFLIVSLGKQQRTNKWVLTRCQCFTQQHFQKHRVSFNFMCSATLSNRASPNFSASLSSAAIMSSSPVLLWTSQHPLPLSVTCKLSPNWHFARRKWVFRGFN